MGKAFIWGAGATGKRVLPLAEEKYEIIGFIDNDPKYHIGGNIKNYKIFSPDKLKNSDFDVVVIASSCLNEITKQMLEMGISKDKIISDFIAVRRNSRIAFLNSLGKLFSERLMIGSIAEGGVYQGEFACEMNRVFPDKKFYLFDTFKGFDNKDVKIEKEKKYSEYGESHLGMTSEELVLSKLPYTANVIIRKGYFPETALGIDDIFCFVNLDFDLFNPTLSGLEYFYPRMVNNGIILIHDYFSLNYRGVKEAVCEFQKKNCVLKLFPIGDENSIGICC